ncbi:sensor histidine kinase [Clostridium formicaceticum]|uniref:histidine kinase n=1 Tax=Clostridium formicaceticum TaxID=1497 RepID=A0AAC9RJK0_9CLOT|nr:HAMP domain-containing sensor histidine kinase [Clostridium formicaceticum]AOY76473.1 two-component sensor histidine kinase [Clostridium formicaceticum]ARE86872.1 Signal transduction histidine-protein kinase BaeS [Clostridium formicaceticum]
MFNKLRSRFILMILGGAIFSIVLVSIITNITLFRKFDLYMRDEQGKRLEEVVQLVEQSYAFHNGWTEGALENIRLSPLIDNFDINIRDAEDHLIFTHYMESTMIQMHNEMMGKMGQGMMGRNHFGMMRNNSRGENYTIDQHDLLFNNESIGKISIGFIGPFLVSEREIVFARGINISIFYGAIISVVAAIFLGMYSSKVFSRPILQITEAANHIRQGKLDTKIEIPNNVLELQELSRSINHLAKSLGDQEGLRKRLTSDISHELRTPLTVLQSHIEAMSDGIWEPTKDKLDICKNEVIRLIKLVEELKYLTDIESHKLTLEMKQYCLSKDLNEIIESFRYQFQNKGIIIHHAIDQDIYIYADKNKIKQVFMNLLSNALKFTNSGGSVNVGMVEQRGEIEITVEDTGSGIEHEDLPYIFERFYRGDISRNRKTGGTGIGLTITKNLIESHGGRISVESKKGKGTKFTILLPSKG